MASTEEKRFTCQVCGVEFTVPEAALRKYPGWRPQRCLRCRKAEGVRGSAARPPQRGGSPRAAAGCPPSVTAAPPPGPAPQPWPTGEPALDAKLQSVLSRHSAGPHEGIFTDGGSSGNPGPGGWAAVHVRGGQIVAQQHGRDPDTTNNRMELTALIAGFKMIGPDDEVTIWSDSQLCVNTVTQWAAGWERRGWRRKDGPIKNLELVKEAYSLAQERPKAKLCWVAAHNGARWNEYVDTLATGHLK